MKRIIAFLSHDEGNPKAISQKFVNKMRENPQIRFFWGEKRVKC